MDLNADQRDALAVQGLATVDDFRDFGKEELEQAIRNMRTTIPGIPAVPAVLDADGNVEVAAVPAVPPILPIILPAKSFHRLLVASIAWHYYTDTSRAVTSTNMHYTNILQDFYTEWKAICKLAKESAPDVPVITKNNPPLKWTETFKDYCNNTFGVRKTPLAYIIRDSVDVLPETRPAGDTTTKIDPLEDGKAHGENGSILNDLIARLSHTHPLYKTDNAKVYSALEEATRGTAYSSTVKSFSRRRDGRAAWLAVVSNHAGIDKWEILQTENMKWLMNTPWTGTSYSLEKFCNQHRSRFVNLEEASNHVDFQLPTEHTRVGYLIDNITNNDPDLRAGIANIRQNVNQTRSDFEASVSVLLQVDPYKKSRSKGNKNKGGQPGANVSGASAGSGNDNSNNDGIGQTGVVFKFHDGSEYLKLTPQQKKELHDWRVSPRGQKFSEAEKKKRKSSRSSTSTKAAIHSAVQSALANERKKQKQESDDVQKMAKIIADASGSAPAPAAPAGANSSSTSVVTDAHTEAAMKLLKIKKRSAQTKSESDK